MKQNKSRNKQIDYQTIHIKLPRDFVDKMDYWQRKLGYNQRVDFFEACVERYIAFANGDYQLPSAEVQRLNQLITAIKLNTDQLNILQKTVDSGFSTILNLDEGNDE